jgi:peptide chain release factor subunit 1
LILAVRGKEMHVADTVDQAFLRRLATWSADGAPVSTLYLDVDGRRYPRKQDYLLRAEQLGHQLLKRSGGLPKSAAASVTKDVERMTGFLAGLERGPTRGVALFSCSAAGLWEEVLVPRPLADRATLADHPQVLPLEALVETYETFCTALVDREKARIFLARMGQIREERDVFDDVPGRHDQGGWSQGRFQRHIDDHVGRHLKRVGDVLLRYFKRQGFDHLILGGPDETVPELERGLHDYLKQRVAARVTLPMAANLNDVLEKSLQVEEEIEVRREREIVEQVSAEAGAGRSGVTGLEPVLAALNDGRVDTLVVPFGFSSAGVRCPSCGWLGLHGSVCPMCGSTAEPAPDVVESGVAKALEQGSRVQSLTLVNGDADRPFDVGALLRF